MARERRSDESDEGGAGRRNGGDLSAAGEKNH